MADRNWLRHEILIVVRVKTAVSDGPRPKALGMQDLVRRRGHELLGNIAAVQRRRGREDGQVGSVKAAITVLWRSDGLIAAVQAGQLPNLLCLLALLELKSMNLSKDLALLFAENVVLVFGLL